MVFSKALDILEWELLNIKEPILGPCTALKQLKRSFKNNDGKLCPFIKIFKMLVVIQNTTGVSHTFTRNHLLYLLEIT